MNHYKILGLEKHCTNDEIKRAYRNNAIKHHPDKGGSAELFKKIAEAYEILSDTDKKFKYDHYYNLEVYGNYTNAFDLFEQVIKKSDLLYAKSKINNEWLYNDFDIEDELINSVIFQRGKNTLNVPKLDETFII